MHMLLVRYYILRMLRAWLAPMLVRARGALLAGGGVRRAAEEQERSKKQAVRLLLV